MSHRLLAALAVLSLLILPATGQQAPADIPIPRPRPETPPGAVASPLPSPAPLAAPGIAPQEAAPPGPDGAASGAGTARPSAPADPGAAQPEPGAPDTPAAPLSAGPADPPAGQTAAPASESPGSAPLPPGLPMASPSNPTAEPGTPNRASYQSMCPAVIAGRVEATPLPPIAEGPCGADAPLAVTAIAVNGRTVPLSAPATLSCAMATQLPAWATAIDGYLSARENTALAEIRSGTSYACRNVNNASDGNLSAHAFADALDVTGFALEDGRTIALPEGWADASSPEGRALRFAHDAACGLFATTLGPEANALHADHLHLDMMCHGDRCVARLCE